MAISTQGEAHETPRIISVDDHVVEPPDLWAHRLPARLRDDGPRVERRHGRVVYADGRPALATGETQGPNVGWCDVWCYESQEWPLHGGYAALGDHGKLAFDPLTYDEILPGCWQQQPRLADMDRNHTDASLCFPTVPRFCGQLFLEGHDKDLALAGVRAYNDWMVEEWCGGDGAGRLIPQAILPLWDAELAADEVYRCADLGVRSVAFSEQPADLDLPSVHTAVWEPLWSACQETDIVVSTHIGSSSRMPGTSDDAPGIVRVALTYENAVHALLDWLLCGTLARFPRLRLALSEGQVGWMPFVLQRADELWTRSARYDDALRERVPELPSSYVADRVYGCIFDDEVGLASRGSIGIGQICFETDYPHADSTWPHSRARAEALCTAAALDDHEQWLFLRGNAIRAYGLERIGITV